MQRFNTFIMIEFLLWLIRFYFPDFVYLFVVLLFGVYFYFIRMYECAFKFRRSVLRHTLSLALSMIMIPLEHLLRTILSFSVCFIFIVDDVVAA